MAKRARIAKDIVVNKHKFRLEIYFALEGHKDIVWEIFPQGHKACLYAFSNKNKLSKIIENKYIYEDTKIRSTN